MKCPYREEATAGRVKYAQDFHSQCFPKPLSEMKIHSINSGPVAPDAPRFI